MAMVLEGLLAFYLFPQIRIKPTREVSGNSNKESRKGGRKSQAGLLFLGHEKRVGR
jgi:hypothetical protein